MSRYLRISPASGGKKVTLFCIDCGGAVVPDQAPLHNKTHVDVDGTYCAVCDARFDNTGVAAAHFNSPKHKKRVSSYDGSAFVKMWCEDCGMKVNEKEGLQCHQSKGHDLVPLSEKMRHLWGFEKEVLPNLAYKREEDQISYLVWNGCGFGPAPQRQDGQQPRGYEHDKIDTESSSKVATALQRDADEVDGLSTASPINHMAMLGHIIGDEIIISSLCRNCSFVFGIYLEDPAFQIVESGVSCMYASKIDASVAGVAKNRCTEGLKIVAKTAVLRAMAQKGKLIVAQANESRPQLKTVPPEDVEFGGETRYVQVKRGDKNGLAPGFYLLSQFEEQYEVEGYTVIN